MTAIDPKMAVDYKTCQHEQTETRQTIINGSTFFWTTCGICGFEGPDKSTEDAAVYGFWEMVAEINELTEDAEMVGT